MKLELGALIDIGGDYYRVVYYQRGQDVLRIDLVHSSPDQLDALKVRKPGEEESEPDSSSENPNRAEVAMEILLELLSQLDDQAGWRRTTVVEEAVRLADIFLTTLEREPDDGEEEV